jgi:hypothetical protein
MSVCPILQIGGSSAAPCIGELCEWWKNGCPAHPKQETQPSGAEQPKPRAKKAKR